jgi:NADH-quinone oxidoreductase subunit N
MDFHAALPEIFLLCMSCVILMADAFLPASRRVVTYLLVQLTLAVAFILTLPQFKEYTVSEITFGGNYVLDDLAVTCKLFIYFFSFIAFAYARETIFVRKIAFGEYYLLGLFSVLGMSIMASANSFLTIFLGLELLSLPLYAMIAMYKDSQAATEAAMKYFVLGALASGLLLYGISFLYGATGHIQIDVIAKALHGEENKTLIAALIFILAGVAFKFGAVPFHMWVPDVYQGAQAPTTLFIASAPKIAAFAITVRILVEALPSLQTDWEHMLLAISILSMFLGNLFAIAQSDLKRMFAYSSIAHIGYTLLGIIAGPRSSQGYSAAMFYIFTYALVAAGAFAIITIMGRQGIEMDKLEDYRGLNARSPWLAFMMLLLLFSMAGVPPTVGFFAKLGLIEALAQAKLVWVAVLALIFALIGAYYYLRVVMLMYFEEPTEKLMNTPILVSKDIFVIVSMNGAAALALGLLPSFFIDICRISVG